MSRQGKLDVRELAAMALLCALAILMVCALTFATRAAFGAPERFRATQTWQKVEPVIWQEAAAAGATRAEQETLLTIAWNESRGQAHAIGDAGCAYSIFQIHLGGLGTHRQVCHNDARLILPPEFDLPRERYQVDVRLATRAALRLLRLRGSLRNPDAALTSYAGCRRHVLRENLDDPPTCAERVLGRHAWWRETGLAARFTLLAAERPAAAWVLDDEREESCRD